MITHSLCWVINAAIALCVLSGIRLPWISSDPNNFGIAAMSLSVGNLAALKLALKNADKRSQIGTALPFLVLYFLLLLYFPLGFEQEITEYAAFRFYFWAVWGLGFLLALSGYQFLFGTPMPFMLMLPIGGMAALLLFWFLFPKTPSTDFTVLAVMVITVVVLAGFVAWLLRG